jgi:hypothetical protein
MMMKASEKATNMYAGAWFSHANAVWRGAVAGVLKHTDVCHGDGASMLTAKMRDLESRRFSACGCRD